MLAHSSVLLADANRQVQIADHLLSVTYPMVKDPKLLMSIVEHCRRAVEDAAEAVVEHHVQGGEYELPSHVKHGTKHDSIAAFADLLKVRRPAIAQGQEAVQLCHDLRLTLQQHKESPTTFIRDEKLVIAGEGFSFLKELSAPELKRSLSILKQFVHAANQHVVKS
jgi:hypothetical protein